MPKVQQGGILEIAQPLPISKVMVVCPHCSKPTRIKHAVLDDGQRVRVCSHCGEQLEVKADEPAVSSERYKAEVVPALQKEFDYGNPCRCRG